MSNYKKEKKNFLQLLSVFSTWNYLSLSNIFLRSESLRFYLNNHSKLSERWMYMCVFSTSYCGNLSMSFFCFKMLLKDSTIDITIQQTLNVTVRKLAIKIAFYTYKKVRLYTRVWFRDFLFRIQRLSMCYRLTMSVVWLLVLRLIYPKASYNKCITASVFTDKKHSR